MAVRTEDTWASTVLGKTNNHMKSIPLENNSYENTIEKLATWLSR
ncbi:hypothetical protein LEMLEM_LOCUS9969 [Lemmus lemmus]